MLLQVALLLEVSALGIPAVLCPDCIVHKLQSLYTLVHVYGVVVLYICMQITINWSYYHNAIMFCV